MIPRAIEPQLRRLAAQFPVITITGPRQSGKTTLARNYFKEFDYVNLEEPETRAYAQEDPKGFLGDHPAPLIIDEVQRVPELLRRGGADGAVCPHRQSSAETES